MTEFNQLKALAELDGLKLISDNPDLVYDKPLPKYPHSYDAIIPLVKKWVESHTEHEDQGKRIDKVQLRPGRHTGPG